MPKKNGKETSRERFLRKYKEAGMVQIATWIPEHKKQEILEDCARLRREHLRDVRYELDEPETFR